MSTPQDRSGRPHGETVHPTASLERVAGRSLREIPGWRLLAMAVTSIVAVASCSSPSNDGTERPLLVLEETVSRTLPESLLVQGVVGSFAGTLAAWHSKRPGIVVVSPDTVSRVGSNAILQPVGVRLHGEEGRLGLLDGFDARRGGIVRLDLNGVELGFQPANVPIVVERASHTRFGWLIGGLSPSRTFDVGLLTEHGFVSLWSRPVEYDPDRPDALPLISAVNGHVLITELRPPYESYAVSYSGNGVKGRTVSWSLDEDQVSPGEGNWALAAVVEIGDRLLYSVTDLSSDRRVLVLVDGSGRILRRIGIHVPLSIVGRSSEENRLIGARSVGGLELVEYQWTWEDSARGSRYPKGFGPSRGRSYR